MTLIQASYPDTPVKTLRSAQKLFIQRFRAGGPHTARVNDETKQRYYVLEVTDKTNRFANCKREARRAN